MAKFLNKKEQVFDFKLTPYGKYLLSIGSFRPTYYAFYDDNIVYDSLYMNISESQNDSITRINDKTQYLEGLLIFEDVEKKASNNKGDKINFFDLDITPTKEVPRKDTFKYDAAIGDSFIESEYANYAPAWKVTILNGTITSTSAKDYMNNLNIPQVNVQVDYRKKVSTQEQILRGHNSDGEKMVLDPLTRNFIPEGVQPSEADISLLSGKFYDERVIHLIKQDLQVHIEELNTEMLTENFDIEIFEQQIEPGSPATGSISVLNTPSNGDTIVISNGTNSYTFEFQLKNEVAEGNIFVQYNPGSHVYTATALEQAIRENTEHISTTMDTANNRVNLENTNLWYLYGEPSLLNRPITTTAAGGTFSIAGFAGAARQKEQLRRKYFYKEDQQIIDGIMMSEQPSYEAFHENLTSGSVEYYFDVLIDRDIDQKIACRNIENLRRDSYYIDVDFECERNDIKAVYYDIYGSEVEPEICLD